MVEESPEVLHEEMTSKKCFLEELSLPNSIIHTLSLPFRELKPNHFIWALVKKKKSKPSPIAAVVVTYP